MDHFTRLGTLTLLFARWELLPSIPVGYHEDPMPQLLLASVSGNWDNGGMERSFRTASCHMAWSLTSNYQTSLLTSEFHLLQARNWEGSSQSVLFFLWTNLRPGSRTHAVRSCDLPSVPNYKAFTHIQHSQKKTVRRGFPELHTVAILVSRFSHLSWTGCSREQWHYLGGSHI